MWINPFKSIFVFGELKKNIVSLFPDITINYLISEAIYGVPYFLYEIELSMPYDAQSKE